MPLTAWIATAFWAGACSLVSAALLAFHIVALPTPPANAALEAALRAHASEDELQGWRMVHVIYQRCACSRRIIDHLVARAHPQGVSERVVIVEAAPETTRALIEAGFVVDDQTAETLRSEWNIESAPLLVITDPSGRVRYAGGYTTQKQGPTIEDVAILKQVRGGAPVLSLPLFGCAVSRELQAALDPLGLQRLLSWRPTFSERATR